MGLFNLQEGQPVRWPGPLSVAQLQALRAAHVAVSPRVEPAGHYLLTPSAAPSYVGAVRVGETVVIIRPKIPVNRVMFLLSYALDPAQWRDTCIELAPDSDVLEAVALAFTHQVRQAIRQGLLRGYRAREEALPSVRGRIRFPEQMGRRFGQLLPVELAFDDYTQDIEENRLLKAALQRLSHTRIRTASIAQRLHQLRPPFDLVTSIAYLPGRIPSLRFTRLNQHYRRAVALACLILENSSLELDGGEVAGTSFLVNMSGVFEQFLYVALREALDLSPGQWRRGEKLLLDQDALIPVQPDFSWWPAPATRRPYPPLFVGDAKYKVLKRSIAGGTSPAPQADIYQMLAYCTAANLPTGLLVYAAGEGNGAFHQIRHVDTTIEVAVLDITGPPETILEEVRQLADRIATQALPARRHRG